MGTGHRGITRATLISMRVRLSWGLPRVCRYSLLKECYPNAILFYDFLQISRETRYQRTRHKNSILSEGPQGLCGVENVAGSNKKCLPLAFSMVDGGLK